MTTRVMNTFIRVVMTSPVPLEDIVQSQHFPPNNSFCTFEQYLAFKSFLISC